MTEVVFHPASRSVESSKGGDSVKKKIAAAAVALCLALALLSPGVTAAGPVYFWGVNDTLVPLSDQTVPRYYGGNIYMPYTIFTVADTGINVFCAAANDLSSILLYNSEKRLKFDVSSATIYDQDNVQYNYSAKTVNGTVYLPAEFVCSFFGLTLTIIQAEPASVVRIKSASAVYNDATFVGINKDEIQSSYYSYFGIESSGDPDSSSSAPSDTDTQTYEQVTVYLTFSELNAGQLDLLLDILDTSDFKCGIFVAADEIADNAELLRRAVGSGHMIGLRLETGTYDEYRKASDLLFEAVKIRTLFVSAGGDVIQESTATAESKGLIFWNTASSWDETEELVLTDITIEIGTLQRGTENLSFTCSEAVLTVTPALLSYLSEKKFDVRRITETSKLS